MKSFLCVLLSVLMLLPLLSACSPDDDTLPLNELYETAVSEELFTSSALMVSCENTIELTQPRLLAGSCAHNGVLYYALASGNGKAQICRRDLATEETQKSEMLDLGDAVSMCYNTAEDCLVVAHGNTTLSIIDPESMTVTSTKTVDRAVIAIAYVASEQGYAVRSPGKNTLQLLDASFTSKRILSLPDGTDAFTLGDLANDDTYIYILLEEQSGSNGDLCAGVMIYDLATKTGYRNVMDSAINRARPVSLSVCGSVFMLGLYDGQGDRFVLGSPTLAGEPDKPADLLARRIHKTVSNTGITSERLFDVYKLAAPLGASNVMQGGCTDGKYGYFCMEDQKNDYENTDIHRTCLVKVDMETNELVDVSDPLPLGHSNDMCYNSRTNQLLVVHCGYNTEGSKRVSLVDPDTLQIIENVSLPFGIYCMAYDEVSDRYMVGRGGGRDFAILDSEFKVEIDRVQVGAADYCSEDRLITQGGDCDSDCVYFVLGGLNDGEPWVNYLVAYDWNGNFICAKIR